MPDYVVFGGHLRSDIPFPELRVADSGSVTWSLQTEDGPPPARELTFLGEACLDGEIMVRHYRFEGGFRLVYDDTGTFDVMDRGARIQWFPAPGANEDAARLDVMGFVFAVAFHAEGTLCLHGSAVAMPSGGIAFLAPKYHGKSTLARALTTAGARLATDDSVPVVVGPPAMMRPGVPQLRLWSDSASRLNGDQSAYRSGYGGKNVLTDIEPARLVLEPVSLSALYLLLPVKPAAGVPDVRRVRMPPVQAALALITHAKLGSMLGKAEAATALDRAAKLAECVPVYRLEIARDFDRLPTVVREFFAWHGDISAPAKDREATA